MRHSASMSLMNTTRHGFCIMVMDFFRKSNHVWRGITVIFHSNNGSSPCRCQAIPITNWISLSYETCVCPSVFSSFSVCLYVPPFVHPCALVSALQCLQFRMDSFHISRHKWALAWEGVPAQRPLRLPVCLSVSVCPSVRPSVCLSGRVSHLFH